MITYRQFSGFLFLLMSSAAMAGTVIEIESEGERSTVFTDGLQARINIDRTDYVIVDYKNHSIKLVSPQQQQVMLLNSADRPAAKRSAPVVRVALSRLGNGQPVAGYATQKYAYSANGNSCGVIYGSQEAYRISGLRELLQAMETMMQSQQDMLGGFAAMIDDCSLAEMNISEHAGTIGVPMRTETAGALDNEIKSIKLDVALPADVFQIPAGYKTVSLEQQMKTLSDDTAAGQQQLQSFQPQMDQVMQQMQQSGQLTPQAMEQMRRAQQMLQHSR